MSADVIPLSFRFDPVRVELTEEGVFEDGRLALFVDYVERDGGRCTMWSGSDRGEAAESAKDCADGGRIPFVDLTGGGAA